MPWHMATVRLRVRNIRRAFVVHSPSLYKPGGLKAGFNAPWKEGRELRVDRKLKTYAEDIVIVVISAA